MKHQIFVMKNQYLLLGTLPEFEFLIGDFKGC